jgi:hypothetical protein
MGARIYISLICRRSEKTVVQIVVLTMVEPCKCCDVDPMNKWNVELRKKFENINKTEIEKRKNFISDLLTEGCDEDRYERCFKIADGKFLCRSGLSVVLKLSRGMQKKLYRLLY